MFVVQAGDETSVKRLRRRGGAWLLVSDNKARDKETGERIYPDVPFPADAVVRGQVMWTGKTL